MLLKKEDYRKITDAAVSSTVEKFLPSLRKYQDLTQDQGWLNDPVKHWSLQKALLTRIEGGDTAVTKGRRLGRGSNEEAVLKQAEANHLLARAHRDIADGIAWRTLGFNRSKIRVLAQAQGSGFLSTPTEGAKLGRRGEEKLALRIVQRGERVLLHDITNILNIGDVSVVTKEGEVYLAESKKRGKQTVTPASVAEKISKGELTTAQSERLLEAQLVISGNEITTPKGKYPIHQVDVAPSHFLQEAQELIAKATKEGFAASFLADYLHLEVTHLPALLTDEKKVHQGKPPDPTGELLGMFSNYDVIQTQLSGEVMRNAVPYTVYPFTSEQVVDIITGRTLLRARLLREPFEQALLSRGWKIRLHIPDEEPGEEDGPALISARRLFPSGVERAYAVLDDGSGFRSHLPLSLLGRFTLEFISVEYLIGILSAVKASFRPGDRGGIFPDNIRDKEMWQ